MHILRSIRSFCCRAKRYEITKTTKRNIPSNISEVLFNLMRSIGKSFIRRFYTNRKIMIQGRLSWQHITSIEYKLCTPHGNNIRNSYGWDFDSENILHKFNRIHSVTIKLNSFLWKITASFKIDLYLLYKLSIHNLQSFFVFRLHRSGEQESSSRRMSPGVL